MTSTNHFIHHTPFNSFDNLDTYLNLDSHFDIYPLDDQTEALTEQFPSQDPGNQVFYNHEEQQEQQEEQEKKNEIEDFGLEQEQQSVQRSASSIELELGRHTNQEREYLSPNGYPTPCQQQQQQQQQHSDHILDGKDVQNTSFLDLISHSQNIQNLYQDIQQEQQGQERKEHQWCQNSDRVPEACDRGSVMSQNEERSDDLEKTRKMDSGLNISDTASSICTISNMINSGLSKNADPNIQRLLVEILRNQQRIESLKEATTSVSNGRTRALSDEGSECNGGTARAVSSTIAMGSSAEGGVNSSSSSTTTTFKANQHQKIQQMFTPAPNQMQPLLGQNVYPPFINDPSFLNLMTPMSSSGSFAMHPSTSSTGNNNNNNNNNSGAGNGVVMNLTQIQGNHPPRNSLMNSVESQGFNGSHTMNSNCESQQSSSQANQGAARTIAHTENTNVTSSSVTYFTRDSQGNTKPYVEIRGARKSTYERLDTLEILNSIPYKYCIRIVLPFGVPDQNNHGSSSSSSSSSKQKSKASDADIGKRNKRQCPYYRVDHFDIEFRLICLDRENFGYDYEVPNGLIVEKHIKTKLSDHQKEIEFRISIHVYSHSFNKKKFVMHIIDRESDTLILETNPFLVFARRSRGGNNRTRSSSASPSSSKQKKARLSSEIDESNGNSQQQEIGQQDMQNHQYQQQQDAHHLSHDGMAFPREMGNPKQSLSSPAKRRNVSQ